MSRARSQESLRRTTSLIAQGHSLPVVLEAIVRAAEAESPDILCSIHLLDEKAQVLRLAAAPSLPEPFSQAVDNLAIGPAVGSCGTAAFLGCQVIVEDIERDPLWASYTGFAASAGLAACWSQPIFASGGEVIGTFAIYRSHPSKPSADDLVFIEAAAELAAIAIGRQRADEELRKSEERARRSSEIERDSARNLTTFFEVSLDMLCIRDMEGRFVRANQAWQASLGYSVEELEGQSMLRFIHPDDAGRTGQVMRQVNRDESEVLGYVNRYRHKDGRYRHLEWRARRIGEMVFGVARDVTERLAVEAEMQAAKQAAEAANRAKSDFLANMSHEIRTPLNGVIGVVAALSQTELTPPQREMVELIQSSGVSLERLVSDILDLSKIEAGRLEIELQPFDLREELGALVELSQIRAQEKGLSFHAEFGDDARGEFHGDCTRIKQVLGNLLSNAVKFTDRGEVRVRLDLVDLDGRGLSSLRLEVEDTGVGFDPASAAALFQRFSQADSSITRRFGGSGLGLSICKALVELMGGEISAHSSPGRGSLFRTVIPLARSQPLADYDAQRKAATVVEGEAAAGGATLGGGALRVLLAEDHPTNQKVVQMILAPFGAVVTVVENGAEAVQAFEAEAFDLVLMDMQMPVMDGLAATRALRRREAAAPARPRTPILMLSANAMLQHRRDALAAGADLHLSKPVTAAALVGGIQEVLAQAALVD